MVKPPLSQLERDQLKSHKCRYPSNGFLDNREAECRAKKVFTEMGVNINPRARNGSGPVSITWTQKPSAQIRFSNSRQRSDSLTWTPTGSRLGRIQHGFERPQANRWRTFGLCLIKPYHADTFQVTPGVKRDCAEVDHD